MKTKWYQVEIKGTTYRTYDIKAESKEKAEELALGAVDEDWEISKAWKRNAEVSRISLDNKELFVDDGTIAIQLPQDNDKSN